MILSLGVRLNDILENGSDFVWPRPDHCPRCKGNRVWSHGFVSAIFDLVGEGVKLRRYRCPECRCIMRLRPSGYFPRFQASMQTIRTCIACLLCTGRWPVDVSRSRQDYWLRNLCRRVCAFWDASWLDRLLEGFDLLARQTGEPPVSRLK